MNLKQRKEPAANSILPLPIPFLGKNFASFLQFFHEVTPRPVVSEGTLSTRLRRGLKRHGGYEDSWLEDAVSFSPQEFKLKYGKRRTWLEIDGIKGDLAEVYDNLSEKSVQYPLFRQRVRNRNGVTMDVVRNAATLSQDDWITHYGGGRRKGFVYDGGLHPEAHGTYSSVTSFLKRIDRYGDKDAIHARLKRGWDIDDVLSRPPIERDATYSVVYVITQISTGKQYVGISVRGERSRWREHLKCAFETNGQTHLYHAMRMTGEADFCMTVVEEGVKSGDELGQRECAWIEKLGTMYPDGLNARSGGAMGRVEGIQVTIDGVIYQSLDAAAREISEQSGLPVHVVRSRIAAGTPIPDKARKQSNHPEAGTILFRKWLGLRKRAKVGETAPIVPEWEDYDTWKHDTGAAGKDHMDLYRPNRDAQWGPTNFSWGSAEERVTSTHGKEIVAFGKVWPSRAAACKAYGIGKSTFEFRLKGGMTVEDALSQPLGKTSRQGVAFIFEGENFRSITEAARVLAERHGISSEKARDRIRREIPSERWSDMSR